MPCWKERVVMLEGKLGEVVRLVVSEVSPPTPATLVQVEEERRQRVRMGWCLALSQGTLLAVLFLLWKKTYMNGPS